MYRLLTPGLSKTFSVIYDHALFRMLVNHQIRYQATRNVGCQLIDCRWPVLPQRSVLVVMDYGKALMAKWLEQASQWHELYCHDLEVMSSNPGRVELLVHGASVLSHRLLGKRNNMLVTLSPLRVGQFQRLSCAFVTTGNVYTSKYVVYEQYNTEGSL